MVRIFLLIIVLLLNTTPAEAQISSIKYISPVDFPISLAGNVGEIRSDHFHTGIDIKASRGVGSPVFAVADGYISRIGVSPTGYGNVLYVTHNDGSTSVYAHLDRFEKRISAWVREQQYSRKSFKVDLYPSADKFPLTQGETIAYLGNSGSSGGAHLHFEIRDSRSQSPINLIAKGLYSVPDRVPPTINRVLLYQVDTIDGVAIAYLKQAVAVTIGTDGQARLATPRLSLSGNGYLAYEVIDYKDGRTNTMGVYSLEQQVDSQTNFSFAIDRVSFATTRYINTFVQYDANRASKYNVLRAYVSPNNALSFYRGLLRRGVITPPESGEVLQINTTVCDDNGNSTTLEFSIVQDQTPATTGAVAPSPSAKIVDCHRSFNYSNQDIDITIEPKSLYESAFLEIDRKGAIFTVGDRDLPLQKAVTLVLKDSINPLRADKVLVVALDADGKRSSVGGEWNGIGVRTKVRRLGRFAIDYDTVSPVITPIAGAADVLKFKISDNLSGIDSYTLLIDGKWALAEYDAKSATLTHHFKRNQTPVKHSVSLTVTDEKSNKKQYKTEKSW